MPLLNGVMDAPDALPMGGVMKRDIENEYGDVVVDDFIFYYVRREQP